MNKNAYCHGSATIIPVPTGGPYYRIWTGVSAHHDTAPLHKLRGYRINRPRRKYGEDYGSLRPRGTPFPIE